jgi:DNA-binding CsgD family transcriptional regulator
MPASKDIEEPLSAFVDDGWWRTDHRARRAKPLIERGRPLVLEHDVATDEDRKVLPIYHEFYRRFDIPWFAAAAFEAGDLTWSATFVRSQGQGPFGPADRARLLDLRHHLHRAVSLALRTTTLLGGALIDLLDAFAVGAVLVDRRGMAVHANRSARSLFGSGLDVTNGRLAAIDPAVNAELQRMMEGVAGLRFSPAAASPVAVPRNGRRPLLVEAMPLAAGAVDDPLCVLRSMVMITDLEFKETSGADRARDVFHLTKAEGRLAARLARGEDIDAAAAVLGVTRHTARSQLKAIFAKTDTHRQAELVALLARLRV